MILYALYLFFRFCLLVCFWCVGFLQVAVSLNRPEYYHCKLLLTIVAGHYAELFTMIL